jgi:hypothetical protein
MASGYINQSEFARRVGLTRGAISIAIKKGQIFREGPGINPEHPVNRAYAERATQNSGNSREVKAGKAAAKLLESEGNIDKLIDALTAMSQNENGQAAPAEQSQPKPTAPKTPAMPEPDIREEITARAVGQKFTSDEKRASAMMKNILLAEKIKELIRRKDVMDFWKRVVGAMENNILKMDERIADEIAAICGVTDPDIVSKVRKRIGDESVTAMTIVKNEAERFSTAFGLTQ